MATKDKSPIINCALCSKRVCTTTEYMQGPDNCPTRLEAKLLSSTSKKYKETKTGEFARLAAVVEGSAYTKVPWADVPVAQTSRLEEIIRFALKMGYKKLGVAFCVGLANEAEILIQILENCRFEVVSVCCKVGGVPKEEIGITNIEKVRPGTRESMCNPISQAAILNKKHCDFNIMLGLCVGHDSLFFKYAEAMTTVFAVKDRVLGHNPLAAIYLSRSFYRRLRSPKLAMNLKKTK